MQSYKNTEESAQDIAEQLRVKVEDDGTLSYDFTVCPTRQDRTGPYFKQDVVAALMATDFVVTDAAFLLGRNRGRLRDYIRGNEDVLELVDDYREGCVDRAERQVIRSALNGDTTDARFILTTLGKDRGFSTRGELTGAGGGPVKTVEVRDESELVEQAKRLGIDPATLGLGGGNPRPDRGEAEGDDA